MKKLFTFVALLAILSLSTPAMAGTHGKDGKISARIISTQIWIRRNLIFKTYLFR